MAQVAASIPYLTGSVKIRQIVNTMAQQRHNTTAFKRVIAAVTAGSTVENEDYIVFAQKGENSKGT